ncbi:MAG: hypothetical protein HY921_01645 [Elusimicrobia bacterium]|nr:hypothetical protein [Elusimicrobiota bacterium]
MDIILRIRILIWLSILGLWGMMLYQFLGEDERQIQQQMQYVANPYRGRPLPTPGSMEESQAPQPRQTSPQPSSLDFIKPLVQTPPRALTPRPRAGRVSPARREARNRIPDQPVPTGFVKTASPHFNVYAEAAPASEDFVRILENLHGNLMLDLAAFSPWANDQKVTIFLFNDQETYHDITGRPAWSGGASSVGRRKVYVYESEELPGILAHELCHIYYDSFFLKGKPDPLWLSEGMATLVQVERGLAAPAWLRENMAILSRGGGFPIADFMSVTTTAGSPDAKVRLWYAQAYSLVRFLIRAQYRSNFYKFSSYLREGRDPAQSLSRAYGLPFNRLKALEYAWRHELAKSAPPAAE